MRHVTGGSQACLQHFLRPRTRTENFVLLRQKRPSQTPLGYGAVAQLIERVVRNDEVVGLIPICSTILRQNGAMVKDALQSFSVGGPFICATDRATDGTAIPTRPESRPDNPRFNPPATLALNLLLRRPEGRGNTPDFRLT